MPDRCHRVILHAGTRLLVIVSFLVVVPHSFAQQMPAAVSNPETKSILQWLITGRGKKPAGKGLDGRMQSQLPRGEEEIGDLNTELEYSRRALPDPSTWTGEKRTEAIQQSQSMSEESDPKSRSPFTPPSQWALRGPIGMEITCPGGDYRAGRVSCLTYDPSNGLYVGAAKGGLWAPFLFLFVPITDRLPTQASGGVAVNPSNPAMIFFGTGDYGTQGGGGGTGVYRTTDYGRNWQHLDAISPSPWKTSRILVAPWNNNLVLVSGTNGIWRSTNSGDTWSRRSAVDISDLQATSSGNVILAGAPGNAVLRSTDQGASWYALTSGIPSGYMGFITIAIAPGNPNRAYVQIAKPAVNGDPIRNGQCRGIYRSDNISAATPAWTDVTPTGNFPGSSPPLPLTAYPYGQGFYHNAIAVHPADANKVFIAGGTMLKSTDAGASWNEVSLPHADIKVIYFRTGDNLMYLGGDGGLFTSTDDGATWSSLLNRLLPTTMFYNIDVGKSNDDVVFGSSQDNSTEGTSPGARSTWLMSNIADGIDATIDWSNPATVWATTQFGDAFRSLTGGMDCGQWPWINADTSIKRTGWSEYIYQDPSDASWVYANGGTFIYYSTNQGTNWNKVNPGALGGIVDNIAVSSDGQYVYGITKSATQRVVGYQKTGPTTWTYSNLTDTLPPFEPVKVITSASDISRAYVLIPPDWRYSGQRIFRTTNKGSTWQNITGNFTSNIPLHDLVENPSNSNYLWIGTDLGVYKSTNGGTTWWWWNKGMPDGVIVNDLEYAYSGSGDYIVAGTFGRSTFERDINAPIYSFISLAIRPYGFDRLGSLVIAPGESGKLAVSTDAGAQWSVASTQSASTLFAGKILDSLRYLLVGASGSIQRSTDGGVSWNSINSPTQSDLADVFFTSQNVGFAVGAGGVVITTTDAGQSWANATNGFPGKLNAVFFTDQLNGFAGGVDVTNQIPQQRLLSTSDGGQSWNVVQTVNGSGQIYDVVFPDTKTGYCTLDSGKILKSLDGGKNWNELPTIGAPTLLSSFFATPSIGWVCGSGGTILGTTDGGNTWHSEESGTNDDLSAIAYIDSNLMVGSSTGVLSRQIQVPASISSVFAPKWNMISIPLSLPDYTKSTLFPSAISQAFAYEGSYLSKATLANGIGYWLKFPDSTTTVMDGYLRNREFVDVTTGWNMIGSVSSEIPVTGIFESPPGIVQSPYFAYNGSYSITTTIRAFQGYWVKVSQPGRLTLDADAFLLPDSAGSVPHGQTPAANLQLDLLNTLSFTDNSGASQTLYFSSGAIEKSLFAKFGLPPVPPDGGFDARYATGMMVEQADAKANRVIPILLRTERYPVAVKWLMRQDGSRAVLSISGKDIAMQRSNTAAVTSDKTELALTIMPTGKPELPDHFALRQNFPNPFNPTTTIEYELPLRTMVTLRIYDLLGQKVATLAEEVEEGGYKRIEWDASGFPSGIYFYRINAGDFMETRKLVLLR